MVKSFTNATINANNKMYNLVMQNMFRIGNKRLAYIPLDLLYIDNRYQRFDTSSDAKINNLVAHWDANRMDPIRVSAHPDEGRFAVLDGLHRTVAAGKRGVDGIEAEILFFDGDANQRLLSEATIFATQNDDVETLTPAQKHNANVVRGIKENVELERVINKYNIPLKDNKGQGRSAIGTLSGFKEALRITATYGEGMIDDIMNVICSSRWNDEPNGFSNVTLSAIKNVLAAHQDIKEQIIAASISYFRTITPNTLLAYGKANYAVRSDRSAMTLAYDDFVSKTLGVSLGYGVENNKMVRVA